MNSIKLPIIILLTLFCEGINAQPYKIPSPKEWEWWYLEDFATDTIPGISLEKAYQFLKNKKSKTITVGVLDTGIDTKHKDLCNKIWENTDEIAGNGIDDDNNGYIDDINGWNFLGNSTYQGYEDERILNNPELVNNKLILQKAKNERKKRIRETKKDAKYVAKVISKWTQKHNHFSEIMNSENYTLNQVFALTPKNRQLKRAIKTTKKWVDYTEWVSNLDPSTTPTKLDTSGELINYIKTYQEYLKEDSTILSRDAQKIEYVKMRKSNPYNINDTHYGNNKVNFNIAKESHGTHVAGIIAANRTNNIGINGISNNSVIMPVRILGDDDEYDKDVALAIRYAVDNGAKVINASFGKSFSPHKEWVFDAIKYAEKKDVLIIIAAGNENLNLDKKHNYPNDSEDLTTEFANNVIVVGAFNPVLSKHLPCFFSNYGKNNVDIFAPGYAIYSTVPGNKYEFMDGTSMAAPVVSGIATLIRSYYPELSASVVKQVILDSGTKIDAKVTIPGHRIKKTKFSNLCNSSSIVNAFSAVVLADKISKSE
jgi:subtilisin family serine protease